MGGQPLFAAPGRRVSGAGWLSRWLASSDPRVAACNVLGFVVGNNQPFFPLYVAWLAPRAAWLSCWAIVSLPFFLAVPWATRRHRAAGKALLPVTGIANIVLCSQILGLAAGLVWLLVPCVLIAALAFRRGETRWLIAMVAFAIAGFAVCKLHPAAIAPLSPFEQARLARLNLGSAGALCLFVVWQFRASICEMIEYKWPSREPK